MHRSKCIQVLQVFFTSRAFRIKYNNHYMADSRADKKNKVSFRQAASGLQQALAAGHFTHFYLLYGEQAYLRNQYRDKIRNALMRGGSGMSLGTGSGSGTGSADSGSSGSGSPGSDSMNTDSRNSDFMNSDPLNLTVYTGSGFTAEQVISIADTLPFFADRRVIVFDSTGLWNSRQMPSSEPDALADYFGTQPDTTYFVFSEPSVDKSRRLYRAMTRKKEDVTVLDCDSVSEEEISQWAGTLFRRRGKNIGGGVLAMFLSFAGTDMYHVYSEADKLCAYVGERGEIRAQDVRDICSPVTRDRIFDMISAIAEKKADRALDIYMDLLRLQTPPQVILSLMERQYSQMMQVKDLMERGASEDGIAAAVGMPAWMIRRYYTPPCRLYRSAGEIRDAYVACVRADALYKSGKSTDRLAVETLIVSNTLKKTGNGHG